MPAAYLNQSVNFIVSILMVPLLLRFLDIGDYLLWAIFTTFGGITLQLESSIQMVSVREISRQYHAGSSLGLRQAIGRAKKAYATLATVVMAPVLGGGALYLTFVASGKVTHHWGLAWLLFAFAYAVNYVFGANNSILLALGRVETFNYVGALTRSFYFLGTLLLLVGGYSVIGICVAFLASVVMGCALIATAAGRSLKRSMPTAKVPVTDDAGMQRASSSDIAKFTLFTFSAFALYKGGVLVATSLFSRDLVGSYTLTLQAFTLLSAAALVPIQIWLARFVKAIVDDNHGKIIGELARTFLYANAAFVAGTACLTLFGNYLLRHIGSKVSLPNAVSILAVAFAFLIEVNLFILINLLVTKRRFEFVKTYVACAAAGLALGLTAVSISHDLVLSLVVVPAIVQAAVCLPLHIKRVSTELRTTPAAFLALLGRSLSDEG